MNAAGYTLCNVHGTNIYYKLTEKSSGAMNMYWYTRGQLVYEVDTHVFDCIIVELRGG